jgi:hypothetical protein
MMLSENAGARALLEELGPKASVRREEGCLVYDFELPDELETSVLGRLLKGAASGMQFVFRLIGRDQTPGEPAKS